MRNIGTWIGAGLIALTGLVAGCKQGAETQAPAAEKRDLEDLDPRSLYEVELEAPQGLSAGEAGTFTLAIRPKDGAEVKPETPLRAELEASGGLRAEKTRLGYADHARVEDKGPVFEIPVTAEAAGEAEIGVDLDFYICIAELCMKTGEELKATTSIQ